jgi:hypothetical protein
MTNKPPVEFKWRGIHHAYLGSFLVAFGLFFLYMNIGNGLNYLNGFYLMFVIIGGYAIVDDLIEHLITEDTPLRRIWNWMVRK